MRERDRQKIRNTRIGSGDVIYEDQVVEQTSGYEALCTHDINKLTTAELVAELARRPNVEKMTNTNGNTWRVYYGMFQYSRSGTGPATILVVKP